MPARVWCRGVAVSYGALAFAALHQVTGSETVAESSDATAQDWTAHFLNQPFGVPLVILAGLVALGIAGAFFSKAFKATFRQKLRLAMLRPEVQRGVLFIGRLGNSTLGVVASIIGIFLIVAALKHNPGDAKGLSGALITLLQQAFGPFLLDIAAVGLMAYGVYSFVEVRYRRLGRH